MTETRGAARTPDQARSGREAPATQRATRPARSLRTPSRAQILLSLIPLAMGLIVIFPLIYAVLGAAKDMSEFSYPPTLFPRNFFNFENYRQVFQKTPILRYMLNSLIVGIAGTFLRLLISILAAYAFAYLNFRGKRFFFALIMGTMMLPTENLIVGNFLIIARLGLIDSYAGILLPMLTSAVQFLLLHQVFKSMPREVYDAARIDGCGNRQFIRSILFPMSRSFIWILGLRAFLSLWNSYLWPLLVTNSTQMRTVQVGITMLQTDDATRFGLVLAAVVLAMLPGLLIFSFAYKSLQKNLVRN